jgi:hypothetical protein
MAVLYWNLCGEYASPIRQLVLDEYQFIFFERIFTSKTIQLTMNPAGKPMLRWSGNECTYVFNATNR